MTGKTPTLNELKRSITSFSKPIAPDKARPPSHYSVGARSAFIRQIDIKDLRQGLLHTAKKVLKLHAYLDEQIEEQEFGPRGHAVEPDEPAVDDMGTYVNWAAVDRKLVTGLDELACRDGILQALTEMVECVACLARVWPTQYEELLYVRR